MVMSLTKHHRRKWVWIIIQVVISETSYLCGEGEREELKY